ncbi:hypothetical protein ACJMK2_039494, partial [Sinanodonta woodiana]
MSYIKRLYGKQEIISIGLTTVLIAIGSCKCGLVYIDDKTFTSNYIEGDVCYTHNDTASKFIHCVSICIKKCKQSCTLISFAEGTCRCHSSYARKINGQNAPDGGKTMYFRIAETHDGRKETITADTTSSLESSSVKEEKPECSSITRNISASTVDSCKT